MADDNLAERIAGYPLVEALLERRSRRFASGLRLNGGPLAYESRRPPQPLSLEEEAALAFAACGITGYALAELPFESGAVAEGGSGNLMMHLAARTIPSGDAAHVTSVFVINDEGTWLIKRPQDHPRQALAGLVEAARQQRFVELYQQSRVRIASRRAEIPREIPFTISLNKWSANQPGTTYFVPVSDMSGLYINMLLAGFDQEARSFVLDERNRFRPAGIGRFARSKGGHLNDDPASFRVGTISFAETWVHEFCAIEQGAALQNLGLMAEALGLGGFAHFAAYPFIWPQALGFRMEQVPFSRTIGASATLRLLLKALRRDLPVPTPVGLELNGQVLLKPYCPPYYAGMREAVLALVDYKFAQGRGTLRDGGAASAWRDGAAIQAGIPRPSEQAIEATIAYCEYLYARYGRFPAGNGPFRTTLAYQAHHLDPDFYDAFYKPGAYRQSHVEHGHR